MNFLNNKIKKFFIPLWIFLFFIFLTLYGDVYESWVIIYLISFPVSVLLLSIFSLYPGIKILLKRYGSFLQRTSILIFLISSQCCQANEFF